MTVPKKKNDLSKILLNTRSTFFIINHVYANTGGMGDPMQIPGGWGIMFNSQCIVLGRSKAKEEIKSTKEITGYIVSAETAKSRYSRIKSKLIYRIKENGGLDPYY
jgi:hypothetical protein